MRFADMHGWTRAEFIMLALLIFLVGFNVGVRTIKAANDLPKSIAEAKALLPRLEAAQKPCKETK